MLYFRHIVYPSPSTIFEHFHRCWSRVREDSVSSFRLFTKKCVRERGQEGERERKKGNWITNIIYHNIVFPHSLHPLCVFLWNIAISFWVTCHNLFDVCYSRRTIYGSVEFDTHAHSAYRRSKPASHTSESHKISINSEWTLRDSCIRVHLCASKNIVRRKNARTDDATMRGTREQINKIEFIIVIIRINWLCVCILLASIFRTFKFDGYQTYLILAKYEFDANFMFFPLFLFQLMLVIPLSFLIYFMFFDLMRISHNMCIIKSKAAGAINFCNIKNGFGCTVHFVRFRHGIRLCEVKFDTYFFASKFNATHSNVCFLLSNECSLYGDIMKLEMI